MDDEELINKVIEQSKIDYEFEEYERMAKILEMSYKEEDERIVNEVIYKLDNGL